MKSLLASARLMLEGQGGAAPRLGGALQTVEERAVHLHVFVTDCLRTCEVASSRQVAAPRPAPLDWQRLVSRLECLFPELTAEGIPTSAPACDAVQIEQVLINLLKNAREAGGAQLLLRFEPGPAGLRVSVLDRGCGMTDVQIAALARKGFTTKPGGSGLGLGLCRTIVALHGGRLLLERREGGGMKIGFCLPA